MTRRGPRGGVGCSAVRHVREGLPDARRVLCAPTRPLRPRDHRCVPAPSARKGTRGTHPEAPGLPRLLTGCCIMHHSASSGKQNGFRIGDSRMGTGRAHRPTSCQPGPRAHPENASAPHPTPPRARTPRCPAAAPRSAGITPPHPTPPHEGDPDSAGRPLTEPAGRQDAGRTRTRRSHLPARSEWSVEGGRHPARGFHQPRPAPALPGASRPGQRARVTTGHQWQRRAAAASGADLGEGGARGGARQLRARGPGLGFPRGGRCLLTRRRTPAPASSPAPTPAWTKLVRHLPAPSPDCPPPIAGPSERTNTKLAASLPPLK
ncbi:unnamed protein product [Rangifer tarandus platyrhynchus]|uniref:Uncharacterized protein n=2 Tax=Rangifer tarandus platyrhynchus TaxID=3082113 RepID=A0ACB0FH47_RANTA|nr:unnamed protein product [Rangifer tarandus platyrhynchus]CAI9712382.1 unnamed protein product [Rangifer tarandus platyrhynchus]